MSALYDALNRSTLATGLLERCSFPQGDRLHCAVSGGADSLALLLLAVRTGRPVTAWHVDHGLRADSSHDFDFVRHIAEALGAAAELRVVTVESGPNLEARARDARFAALPTDVHRPHS